MYGTKINIFPKGFKSRFTRSFFCIFHFYFLKFLKRNIFLKNDYIYKLEYNKFISFHKEEISQMEHYKLFFASVNVISNVFEVWTN